MFLKNINNEKIFKILIDTGEGFKNLETCKKYGIFYQQMVVTETAYY